jgi:hypothetical protein
MRIHRAALVGLLSAFCLSESAQAEVLIRWDQDRVPSRESLGISTLVVPAGNSAAVREAIGQGYRLYLEVEASAVAGLIPSGEGLAGVVVKGKISPIQLRQLRQRFQSRGRRVLALDERGKWPHIRSNWVTKNKEVLQVSGRSAQPWIENNAAFVRITNPTHAGSAPLLTYAWKPITLSEIDEGPALENYLVAIAEAGSVGGDLVLPLHERFQRRLLMGQPRARAEWNEIRRYLEFYAWNLAGRYQPIANIGVVTAEPMLWFEVMNLLARHNLAFQLIAPTDLTTRALDAFKLLIVLDRPNAAQIQRLAEFERKNGAVVIGGLDGDFAPLKARVVNRITDPNAFALEMRQILGRDHRVIDIWNGITVLTAPYKDPDGSTVLVTLLNYAYQPLPVQLRVAGTFSLVHYESPEEPPALLPHQHRDGYTEFVVPALRIGGRLFLSQQP